MIVLKVTGHRIRIDDKDHALFVGKTWSPVPNGQGWRAEREESGKKWFLHRFIMKPPPGFEVDHINGDALDNRRSNLRICSHLENSRNRRLSKNSTTGFKGVSLKKGYNRKKYLAHIQICGKRKYIGYFMTPQEAARAYDFEAKNNFGEFAKLNFEKGC